MRFRNGDTAYAVYTAIGKWGPNGETRELAGVAVERAGRAPTYLPCTGEVTSELGPDWFATAGVTSKGEDFKLPDRAPVPTVERASFRVERPAAAAPRTDLEIQSASLSFDPNATHWYVTSKICNNAEAGHSGSLQYELRLVANGRFWMIGSVKSNDTLNAGYCRTRDKMSFAVNTNVPNGEYRIEFVISEYDGGKYYIRDRTTFDKTFIRRAG
jgi:hypothetical protein